MKIIKIITVSEEIVNDRSRIEKSLIAISRFSSIHTPREEVKGYIERDRVSLILQEVAEGDRG